MLKSCALLCAFVIIIFLKLFQCPFKQIQDVEPPLPPQKENDN